MSAEEILKTLSRTINLLEDDNKVKRRKALEEVRRETVDRSPPLDKNELQKVSTQLHRAILSRISDESEKCREISVNIIKGFLITTPDPTGVLTSLFPVFVTRLGQPDVVEESEELRLTMVQMLTLIIDLIKEGAVNFLNDYIKILKQTIKDSFADIKRESCTCASLLAKTMPAYFHQHSENLINPLLTQISHQHSKVRIAVIACIGDVIKFGNNKSVEDVISHFAQRVFDPIPGVRLCLTKVMGDWLLNLPDRYSFWHRMIPLLLSAIDDTQAENAKAAAEFWHKAGKQFEEENEQDLKDKLDFSIENPVWYPEGVERPCIGCRVLIYRNFGRFIHGIQNDISDWVVDTRVKTASLLYHCILNVEDSVTQFLSKTFVALQKGALDDNKDVTSYIEKSSELIGYFVSPESWLEIILPIVSSAQNEAGLLILANIIKGSQPDILKHYLDKIVEAVSQDDVCRTFQQKKYLEALQSVVLQLSYTQGESLEPYKQELFTVTVSSIALALDQTVAEKGQSSLGALAGALNCAIPELYQACTAQLLVKLADKSKIMSSLSAEFLIFETLVLSSGSSIGIAVPEVIDLFKMYLEPEKDAELRLKFSTVLCKLALHANKTINSEGKLDEHVVLLIKDIILPNCVWKAGKTNAANRTSCLTTLWALLEGGMVSGDQLDSLSLDLLPKLVSLLDEDSTTARQIATKALKKLITCAEIDIDELHKLIPELLKRLDDRDDSVRISVTETFNALVDALPRPYNHALYKAHAEFLYQGLLIHLDDADTSVQDAVFSVLNNAARLAPDVLKEQVSIVREKHRSPKYCDKLLEVVNSSGDA